MHPHTHAHTEPSPLLYLLGRHSASA
ncbi:hypothetical protein E2C01_075814 [Portunus trituberculatus]|uniref:Uncharacterized protein n=1 Tax=Portunus trituberculatus TaxID=210409 RepID=A0A5B7II23_PORTR|nr:hypothetical protein [Portunus trituberculatus]